MNQRNDDDDDRDDEFGEDRPGGLGDERREGCVLGDRCCCPHMFHTSDECFDAEWAERYFAEDEQEKSDV